MSEKGVIVLFGAETNTDEALECLLRSNGYLIHCVKKEEELERELQESETVALLFLMCQGGKRAENLALLASCRQNSEKPLIADVQGEDEMLRILALNAGADDCLWSGCTVLEKVARIQAQVKMYQRLFLKQNQSKVIKMDGLEVDDTTKLVKVEGTKVDLTPTEYKILHLLMESPGRVLSNRQIYEKIWKMEPIGADNTVAVHIRHIREKIEQNPQNPRYLRVVWGQGYKVG